ncbi:MAG: hypothetical protein HLUCCO16_05530 [Phormidium sp. OSCR]|nr:MAG: hypothetical protein HLUCCO16_05530 [Phormidium sp. OSCR]
MRAALVLLEDQEHRDRGEDMDGEAAIEGQQTTSEQPDSDRDYGVAWAEWFQDLESIEPPIERAAVKPSQSAIEEMIVEKYRKQGLEL